MAFKWICQKNTQKFFNSKTKIGAECKGESLPKQNTAQQQEISYILYVNINANFSFQNRILFQNRKLWAVWVCYWRDLVQRLQDGLEELVGGLAQVVDAVFEALLDLGMLQRLLHTHIVRQTAAKHITSLHIRRDVATHLSLPPGSQRDLKDKYPNFEVALKCILMVNPYLLVCSYIRWKSDLNK